MHGMQITSAVVDIAPLCSSCAHTESDLWGGLGNAPQAGEQSQACAANGCRISAVVNTGEALASEPLTPALHMTDLRPHQPAYMSMLARFCLALRTAVRELRQGYEDGGLQRLLASDLPHPHPVSQAQATI